MSTLTCRGQFCGSGPPRLLMWINLELNLSALMAVHEH
jgi:hypothetical protein